MKRIAAFHHGRGPERLEMLRTLREKLLPSLRLQAECFRGTIVPQLAANGIHLRSWDDLTLGQRGEAGTFFDSEVSPALTPLVFDPAHPFPFLSNLSVSLAFLLRDEQKDSAMYARVKVPSVLKQWVRLQADVRPGEKVLTPLSEVIRGNVHKLYAGMTLSGATLFRLTLDAEVEIDDDSGEGLREIVIEQIRQRRYEPVVRLEFAPGADPSIRDMLRERFQLSPDDVYDVPEHVDYTSLFEIAGLQVPALRDSPWSPLPIPALEGNSDVFAAIRSGDILLHHPYDSFDASVERFIAAAADDPATVSVKMTAYRIGDDTPFVKSLIKAAERG
jgi:polyphosphate kinase